LVILANYYIGSGEWAKYGRDVMKNPPSAPPKAQALIEIAVIAPILIFLLIGVVEVGWLLRCYLVLANVDREAARFAVRPGYVDYDAENPDYSPIIAHTFNALSNQIEFTPTGIIIVSRIYIDTGYPCDPAIIWDVVQPDYLKCDCATVAQNPYTDTIAVTPLDVATYTYTWPETTTTKTRLDYALLRTELITSNLIHNCHLMNRGLNRPQVDDVIYVEMEYRQPQLFGFPGWNNPLMNPVALYGHSIFRRIEGR